jgi:hypothetical protein
VSDVSHDEKTFLARMQHEVDDLASIIAIEEWYGRKLRELRGQSSPEAGHRAEPDEDAPILAREGTADRLDLAEKERLLRLLYENAVAKLTGRAAEDLADPDSDAHREIIDRFDGAWRELANR